MLTKNNFINTQYLSNYDLINKYNLMSIHKIPTIRNIVLEFNLATFLKAFDLNLNKEVTNEVQVKAFLFLYLFSAVLPFINNKKRTVIKIKNKNLNDLASTNYALKMILSNKKEIIALLFTLFIENWSNAIAEEQNFFNKNMTSSSEYLNSKKILFTSFLPVSIFSETENLSQMLPGLNTKELDLSINCLIQNPFIVKDYKKFLKNLPLFWING